MIEGSHQTFYYVLENGVVNVYIAKGSGRVLKTYNFDDATGDELHRLVRGRIDLDLSEIQGLIRELNR